MDKIQTKDIIEFENLLKNGSSSEIREYLTDERGEYYENIKLGNRLTCKIFKEIPLELFYQDDNSCKLLPKSNVIRRNCYAAIVIDDLHLEKVEIRRSAFYHWYFLGKTEFHEVTFLNEADFVDVRFMNRVHFFNCTFVQNARFSGARFINNPNNGYNDPNHPDSVSFMRSSFTGPAYFINCKSNLEIDFSQVHFKKEINFTETRFEKRADFVSSLFHGEAYFQKTHFKDAANFAKAKFLDSVDFENSQFYRQLNFRKTTFKDRLILKVDTFPTTDILPLPDRTRNDIKYYVNFTEAVFDSIASFDPAKLCKDETLSSKPSKLITLQRHMLANPP